MYIEAGSSSIFSTTGVDGSADAFPLLMIVIGFCSFTSTNFFSKSVPVNLTD